MNWKSARHFANARERGEVLFIQLQFKRHERDASEARTIKARRANVL